MKAKTSKINNVILIVMVVLLVLVVALINNAYHGNAHLIQSILYYFLGAIVWGLINAFVHEFGHIIAGKKNGFKTLALSVWFFRWTRVRKKFRFSFIMMGDESGYTETVPTSAENLGKRLKKMSLGGIVASGIMTVLSIVPLFFCEGLKYQVYCLLAIALPVSAYYFFGNALPMIYGGARNDGAVILGVNGGEDELKVLLSALAIQAELYNGKTPSEIDEKYYFDVPQVSEESHEFSMIMDLRYAYYVDKGDYDNAIKISDRMISIVEDVPKSCQIPIKMNALYTACVLNYDEEKADGLMYELEKPLNSFDNATTLRLKFAYLLYVKKEKENLADFYEMAIKQAAKNNVLGIALYEKKLLDKMKEEI